MEYKEIIKLLDAGFSKDDILQMDSADPEQKDPEQKDPEQKDPEQKDPEQKDPEQTDNALAEIMSQLKGAVDDMKKEVIAMNIMHSRQEDDKTGEDIIANIINPPKYNKKEGK